MNKKIIIHQENLQQLLMEYVYEVINQDLWGLDEEHQDIIAETVVDQITEHLDAPSILRKAENVLESMHPDWREEEDDE